MTPTGQLAMNLGMDAALERAEAWAREARKVMARFVAEGKTFTADDIREIVGDPPGSGNALGAVIHGAARQGWIRSVGRRFSTRPEARRRKIDVWSGR